MKNILFIFTFLFYTFTLLSQTGLRVNGAKIIIPIGAVVWIDGGQNGNFTATNANSTEAKIDLDGKLGLGGNWINNNASADVLVNKDTNGLLEFRGNIGEQTLGGSATKNFTFEKLRISDQAKLLIKEDQSVTLGGDFILKGGMRIASNPLGSGSFLDNGTILQSGKALVGRFVENEGKTHLVSPSVSDAKGAQLIHANKGNYNVYFYDESTSPVWKRIFPTTDLHAGQGYAIVYTDTNSIYFKGKLNYGNINHKISDNLNSWNLVGNPYPSGLDAEDFLYINAVTNGSIYGTLYFWDESLISDANDYASWNDVGSARGNIGGTPPNKYIGSGQAFWVQSKAKPGNTIHFTNAMRELNNTQFFIQEPDQFPRIKLSVHNENGDFNEILIGFLEEATYGEDVLYDGHKLEGNPKLSFYSFVQGSGDKFVIQGIPLLLKDEVISLGLTIANNGEYIFKREMLENFATATDIYFYDKLLDKAYDLNTTSEISYDLNAGEINDRFELRFSHRSSGIQKTENLKETVVTLNNSVLSVKNLEDANSLRIIDMSGKLIRNYKTDGLDHVDLELNLAKGIYLIVIQSSGHIQTEQIMLY